MWVKNSIVKYHGLYQSPKVILQFQYFYMDQSSCLSMLVLPPGSLVYTDLASLYTVFFCCFFFVFFFSPEGRQGALGRENTSRIGSPK